MQEGRIDALRITELLSSDIPQVVAIEQQSNPEPWTHESFLEELLRPHSCMLVARIAAGCGEIVAGYICFWVVADEIQILNIADPSGLPEAGHREGLIASLSEMWF